MHITCGRNRMDVGEGWTLLGGGYIEEMVLEQCGVGCMGHINLKCGEVKCREHMDSSYLSFSCFDRGGGVRFISP